MKKNKFNILFIGGTGRNGSTIFAKILNQTANVINIGEAARYSLSQRMQRMEIPCECGKLVDDCEFWSNKNIINTDQNLDNRLLKFKKIIRLFFFSYFAGSKQYQKTKKHILNIYNQINRNQSIFIDTTKHPSFSLIYNDIDQFNIFYIHLVRSPYQFVTSQTKRKKYLPGKASILKASMQWLFYNFFFEVFRFFNNKKCIRIFYEDFVKNPNYVIEKIEERYKDFNISFEKLNSCNQITLNKIGHSLAGNPDKFSKNKIKIEERTHSIPIFRKFLITLFCLPLIMLYINKYHKFK